MKFLHTIAKRGRLFEILRFAFYSFLVYGHYSNIFYMPRISIGTRYMMVFWPLRRKIQSTSNWSILRARQGEEGHTCIWSFMTFSFIDCLKLHRYLHLLSLGGMVNCMYVTFWSDWWMIVHISHVYMAGLGR